MYEDLRTPVYALVAQNGDEATLNKIINLYKSTDSSELKVILLQYVSFILFYFTLNCKVVTSLCINVFLFRVLPLQPTPELTRKAFEFSLTSDVRDQDLFHLYLSYVLFIVMIIVIIFLCIIL